MGDMGASGPASEVGTSGEGGPVDSCMGEESGTGVWSGSLRRR
jgi:hypothetical protein